MTIMYNFGALHRDRILPRFMIHTYKSFLIKDSFYYLFLSYIIENYLARIFQKCLNRSNSAYNEA